MKTIFTLIFILFLSSSLKAQNNFEKVIDTLGSAFASCVKETFDGGYVICGESTLGGNDVSIIKFDSLGNIEWAKVYGGFGMDAGADIEQTPDSGYIVDAGFNTGLNSQTWVLRLDVNGDTLWTQKYSLGSGATDAYNMAVGIGGYLGITGTYKNNNTSQLEAFLLLIDSSGTLLNSKTNYFNIKSEGHALVQLSNANFLITGIKSNGLTNPEIFLIKTNPFGDTIWTKAYGTSKVNNAFDIQATNDGGFVIAGYRFNNLCPCYNSYVIKTDMNGDTLWTKLYLDGHESIAYSIEQTTDGGYIIAGTSYASGVNNFYDLFLMKINSVGDTLWSRQFGGNAPDYGYFVRQTKDGGYIVSGSTSSYGGIYLIKTDSLGRVNSSTGTVEINNPLDFSIFPNPNNGVFSLQVKGISKLHSFIEIYNLNGERVYTCQLTNNSKNNINLSFLNTGLYVVLLKSDDKIYTKKISIQK